MKFELTAETKDFYGIKLFRIRALVSFGNVEKGELGGWVEKESNLSQVYGDAWVYGDARVYGNAQVSGDALVYGNALVYGKALVSGDARVYGNAWVSGFTAEQTEEVKQDFFKILAENRPEVPALLEKLREGKIDGSCYEGECACLVGTIAKIKACDYRTIGPDSDRPAERWFMGISRGNTPADNLTSEQTEKWILEFLAQNPEKEAA